MPLQGSLRGDWVVRVVPARKVLVPFSEEHAMNRRPLANQEELPHHKSTSTHVLTMGLISPTLQVNICFY